MLNIDEFSVSLFEEAKRFLEKAREASGDGRTAFLHAAILLGFSSLEAHINAIAEEQLLHDGLELYDKSILMEKEVRYKNGGFELGDLKIYRLQDRIEYLFQRFGKGELDKKSSYWSGFMEAASLRNKLTHPKENTEVTLGAVEIALRAVLELINVLYSSIYRRPYPAFRRGLDSKLDF